MSYPPRARRLFHRGKSPQQSTPYETSATSGLGNHQGPSQSEDSDAGKEPIIEEPYGLFVLHDLPNAESRALDIVAVHGLGGHWRSTWTDSQNGKNWLRDFLPRQLERNHVKSRIMSYGYNSGTIFSRSVSNIDDAAQELLNRLNGERRSSAEKMRPIIFIAHSLGGVVVKKTMIVAHDRSRRYSELRDQVRAFVFLGVPHRGSDQAFWLRFVAELSSIVQLGLAGNANFVAALQANSPAFAEISASSVERLQSPSIDIRTFYESEKTVNQLIVDKSSAVLNVSNEIASPISGTNHRTICKFSREESQAYRQIWRAILDIAEQILREESNLSSAEPAQTQRKKQTLALQNPHTRKAGNLGTFRFPPADISDRWRVLFDTRPWPGYTPQIRQFSKQYLEPPRVLTSITYIDSEGSKPLRLRASVSEVTPVSFRSLLESWHDTRCWGISGYWLEIAPGDTDMQNGRCNTYGMDKNIRVDDYNITVHHVKFYHAYAEVPEVLCWLVHIDSSNHANHRMSVEALDISAEGFTLKINTWSDSYIFELEAEWLAFSRDRTDIEVFPETILPHPRSTDTIFKFPTGKFKRPPSCFLGLTYLDTIAGPAVRVNVSAKNITEDMVMVGANSWADTQIWRLGFIGLAIL